MSPHPPPVPPDQRSDKDPARDSRGGAEGKGEAANKKPTGDKTGRSGAVQQNTRNTGYQQDR